MTEPKQKTEVPATTEIIGILRRRKMNSVDSIAALEIVKTSIVCQMVHDSLLRLETKQIHVQVDPEAFEKVMNKVLKESGVKP